MINLEEYGNLRDDGVGLLGYRHNSDVENINSKYEHNNMHNRLSIERLFIQDKFEYN